MSLFQHSVLNKYLKEANQEEIKAAYKRLTLFFHNPYIQQNIRESKEEQFQEGFLTSLFVEVLGYTINPNPEFNLTTEFKNEKGAKKADGAILQDKSAIGVIELKSTKTKDLESIRLQAFDYKANQSKCVYVITSNFEKIRFYINNAVDFEEFDLFKLKYEDFKLLWLCLAKENLLKGIPLAIKESSVLKEENVTNQIYVDYSLFKRELYADLIQNNLELEIFSGKEEKEIKLLLFKKSQKLLDRFLFIFFGEDRGLLPPNSISEIIKQWENQSDWGDEVALYDRYKKYFHLLDTGWKGKKYEIFAYNGGLFAPDEILDSIIISDEVLQKHTKILTAYDFETDVDVNILGHIFENSLNEIEEITAKILSETTGHAPLSTQLAVSKRKKDGVFYTPKYITKYIVENTVGKLCNEKKTELAIEESEYLKSRKGRTKKKLLELAEKLDSYRNWLLTLTICDPACGSGAFLNQALDFLIREHHYIDELKAKLLDVPMIFTEVENSILENNIFGVDINEESVEIAKLSLWLRTAQKGRKLTTLSNNIKCGNSLIDDPDIAGEKAFNWQNEFPDVFSKKKKRAWHITTATHNSRYSQRMFDNHISLGKAVWLSEKEELIVAQTIADIAGSDELNILAYNICGDHFHLLLVCEEDEVPKIVQKIKSVSARACNIAMGRTVSETREPAPSPSASISSREKGEHAPQRGKTQAHLWTQKFGCKKVTSDQQQENTINYIKNNRNKHQLPENKELQSIIPKMLCTHQHAFRTEYSGGFDVVIGNPPYVTRGISAQLKEALNSNYQTAQYQLDLYVAFIEQGVRLLKTKRIISYIVPNSWLKNMMMSECRKFILRNLDIQLLTPSLENVFPDASVDTMIFIGIKQEIGNRTEISKFHNQELIYRHSVKQSRFLSNEGYIFDVEVSEDVLPIVKKMRNDVSVVGEIFNVIRGINPYDKYTGQSQEVIKTRAYHSNHKKNETFVPELKGLHTSRYLFHWDKKHYISYGKWLAAPRENKYFEGDRIVFREILGKTLVSTLIRENFKIDRSLYIAKQEEHSKDSFDVQFILGILNSKLLAFYFRYSNNEFDKLFPKIRVAEFKNLPIKNTEKELQKDLSLKVGVMLSSSKELNVKLGKLQKYIQSQYSIEKLSKKLKNWHELEFGEFIKELNKAIKKSNNNNNNNNETRPIALLTKMDEMEWMEVFETKKAEAQKLKSEIDKTDCEIDQMVYELYGLTGEEIEIVEGAV